MFVIQYHNNTYYSKGSHAMGCNRTFIYKFVLHSMCKAGVVTERGKGILLQLIKIVCTKLWARTQLACNIADKTLINWLGCECGWVVTMAYSAELYNSSEKYWHYFCGKQIETWAIWSETRQRPCTWKRTISKQNYLSCECQFFLEKLYL